MTPDPEMEWCLRELVREIAACCARRVARGKPPLPPYRDGIKGQRETRSQPGHKHRRAA